MLSLVKKQKKKKTKRVLPKGQACEQQQDRACLHHTQALVREIETCQEHFQAVKKHSSSPNRLFTAYGTNVFCPHWSWLTSPALAYWLNIYSSIYLKTILFTQQVWHYSGPLEIIIYLKSGRLRQENRWLLTERMGKLQVTAVAFKFYF